MGTRGVRIREMASDQDLQKIKRDDGTNASKTNQLTKVEVGANAFDRFQHKWKRRLENGGGTASLIISK